MTDKTTLFDAMNEKRFKSTEARVLDFCTSAAKRKAVGENPIKGILTGFPVLDKRIDGLQPGITILSGRSHAGKTIAFNNLILGVVRNNPNAKVLDITIDDSADKIINRFLANMANETINDIGFPDRVRVKRDVESFNKFSENYIKATDELIALSDRINIVDASDLNKYSEIIQLITDEKNALNEGEELVVFIDNFHKIRPDIFKREESTIKMSEGLKELSVKLSIPIVQTAELRKLNHLGRPEIEEIKDSIDLVYDSDVVILLHNQHQVTKGDTRAVYTVGPVWNQLDVPVIELHLAKNKQGDEHGFLYYAFFGWKGQIKELDPDSFDTYKLEINNSKTQKTSRYGG